MLIQFTGQSKPLVAALWPQDGDINSAMLDCARDVLQKQRLSLQKNNQTPLLGFPVQLNRQFWGAVVLELGGHQSDNIKAILKLLNWGTTWLQFALHEYDTFVADTARPESPGARHQHQQLQFLTQLLQQPSFAETAITAVNGLCADFNLGRVSLGYFVNNKLQLLAVSHSANFDPRSEPMQLIHEAMLEATQQRIAIDVPAESLPEGTICRAHTALKEKHLLTSCHTRLVFNEQRLLGVLTIEHSDTTVNTLPALEFIERIAPGLSNILRLKNEAHQSVATALKRSLGRSLNQLLGNNATVERLVFVCLSVFFISLFIPMNFKVRSNALVESTNKHLVVAPYQGFIGEIHARPGDAVNADQILAKLKDDELKLERRKFTSEQQQLRLEYDNALANANRAQAAIVNAQLEQSKIQLRLVEQKLERVQLRSPIAGVVVSEDISQSIGAPVEQGEELFEIADAEAFKVSLFVKEQDIAFIKPNQKATLTLKSLPGTYLEIAIERITPLSELREQRNYFRVDAKLPQQHPELRPGMTGAAKIHIAKRAFGWILFHDFWSWLRLHLWV